MARHKKPEPEVIHQVQGQTSERRPLTTTLMEVAETIDMQPAKLSSFAQMSLAERVEEARACVDRAETIADATYWQGALDALEAYSSGTTMPEVIGAGVKKSA